MKRYTQPVVQTQPGPAFKIAEVPLFEDPRGKWVLYEDAKLEIRQMAQVVAECHEEIERLRVELARAIQVVADYDAELAKLRAAPEPSETPEERRLRVDWGMEPVEKATVLCLAADCPHVALSGQAFCYFHQERAKFQDAGESNPPQNIGRPALNDTNVDHALNCPCAKCKADPVKQAQLAEMRAAQKSGASRDGS